MAEFTLQVWDLFFNQGDLRLRLNRYTSDSPIQASFLATESAPGQKPLMGGVTFVSEVEKLRGGALEENIVTPVGANEYRRLVNLQQGDLTVVAALPEGFVIPTLDDVFPQPFSFKLFGTRMAFYWTVGAEPQQFYWKLAKGDADLGCKQLNRELLKRGGVPLDAKTLQLEPREIRVLEYLRDQENDEAPTQRMIGRKIGEEEDTAGILCRKLERDLRLIHRPHGERKGYRLTAAGQAFLRGRSA